MEYDMSIEITRSVRQIVSDVEELIHQFEESVNGREYPEYYDNLVNRLRDSAIDLGVVFEEDASNTNLIAHRKFDCVSYALSLDNRLYKDKILSRQEPLYRERVSRLIRELYVMIQDSDIEDDEKGILMIAAQMRDAQVLQDKCSNIHFKLESEDKQLIEEIERFICTGVMDGTEKRKLVLH